VHPNIVQVHNRKAEGFSSLSDVAIQRQVQILSKRQVKCLPGGQFGAGLPAAISRAAVGQQ
jgi:hypothetical protein